MRFWARFHSKNQPNGENHEPPISYASQVAADGIHLCGWSCSAAQPIFFCCFILSFALCVTPAKVERFRAQKHDPFIAHLFDRICRYSGSSFNSVHKSLNSVVFHRRVKEITPTSFSGVSNRSFEPKASEDERRSQTGKPYFTASSESKNLFRIGSDPTS